MSETAHFCFADDPEQQTSEWRPCPENLCESEELVRFVKRVEEAMDDPVDMRAVALIEAALRDLHWRDGSYERAKVTA